VAIGESQEKVGPTGEINHEGQDKQDGDEKRSEAPEHSEEARRILAAQEPWQALGVERDASPKVCEAAYRRLCLRLHPDKCKDPLGVEAMGKLADAKLWGTAREEYEETQRRKTEQQWWEKQAEGVMRSWLSSGAALKALEAEEELQRFFHEVDMCLEGLWGLEAGAAEWLGLWWAGNQKSRVQVADPTGGGRPRRRVTRTQMYDSEAIDQLELQRREALKEEKTKN
jgi:DnaJ-class molecular chaperone